MNEGGILREAPPTELGSNHRETLDSGIIPLQYYSPESLPYLLTFLLTYLGLFRFDN